MDKDNLLITLKDINNVEHCLTDLSCIQGLDIDGKFWQLHLGEYGSVIVEYANNKKALQQIKDYLTY